jgi:hypothetical protein
MADKPDIKKIPEITELPDARIRPVSSFDEPTGSSLSENKLISSSLEGSECYEVPA